MTHNVDSRPVPPVAQATTAAGPSAMDRLDRALEGLWHLLSSMRVAMLIMLAIAILGVAGSLLMQMPSDIVGNAEQEKLWVDSVRPRFGGWTDILRVLGLFNVFNSILFRLLAAALTISLIACSIHRIPGIIRTARNPRVDVGPAFFEHAPEHEAIVSRRSADEVREIVEGLFRSRRYRTLSMDDGTVHVYADRFRWAPLAGLVGHLAIVVIMLGAIVGGMFRYRNPEFMVTEGETLPALAEPGLSIEVLDFTDEYDTTTGMPIDYASAIVAYKDGVEIERHTVRVNDPYRYNGLTFYQAFLGIRRRFRHQRRRRDRRGVEECRFAYEGDQKHKFGTLQIPGTPYMAEITGTAGTANDPIKPGQLQVGLYSTGATRFTDPEGDRPGRRHGHRRSHIHVRARDPVHGPQRRPRPRGTAHLDRLHPPVPRVPGPVFDPAQARLGPHHRATQRRCRGWRGDLGPQGCHRWFPSSNSSFPTFARRSARQAQA